jgi:outer membrane protein assembly factor BamB
LLSNTIPGDPYLLLESFDLVNWFTNQALLATNTTSFAQPIPMTDAAAYFFAIQAAPGTLRWAVPLVDPSTGTNNMFGSGGLDASPSLSSDGTTIYMTTANMTLSAIDLASGAVKWTDSIYTYNTNETLTFECTSSTVVTASNLYVGSADGYLYCLDAATGITNWQIYLGNVAVHGTPALDSSLGRIYVPLNEGALYSRTTGLMCLNTDTNHATNWFFIPQDPYHDNYGDINCSVAVKPNGDIVFISEGYRIYCLSPAGNLRWFLPCPGHGEPDSSPAITSSGRILVGSGSSYLYCLEADGAPAWYCDVTPVSALNDHGPIECSPTVDSADVCYFGCGAHGDNYAAYLYCLNSSGGTNWLFPVPDYGAIVGSPAIGQTALYFGTGYGTFVALTNGSQAWTFSVSNQAAIYSSALICQDGSIVFGAEDGWLYCLWGSSLPAGSDSTWPTFHQNGQRTGLAAATQLPAEDTGAPFVYNGTNDGSTFTFNIVGVPTSVSNSAWNVYASDDLIHWTNVQSNLTLVLPPTGTDASGTNTFTDATVQGVPQRFYQLANSNGVSRAIGFVNLTINSGSNLVANQLCQVDDNILEQAGSLGNWPMNTLNALFNFYDSAANMDQTVVLKW